MIQTVDDNLTAAHYRLIELRRQRRELMALHGASAKSSLASLDAQIKALSIATRPLLVLENPSAREILTSLPQTPDNGLLIVLDEAQCRTLANPACSATTRYLARTLARGFKGQTIIPEWRHPEGSVPTTVAPSLSILFLATRDTTARLLTCPLLAAEGLSEHIIPIDGRTAISEAELRSLSQILPAIIDRRDMAGSTSEPPNHQEIIDAKEFSTGRAGKIQTALQFWVQETRASPPGNGMLEGLIHEVEGFRAALLAEQAEAVQFAEETTMLEKLQKLGLCTFRQLARTYPSQAQNRNSLEPALKRLQKKGLIGRTSNERLFAMPKEGDESSAIQLLTH